MSRRPAAWGAAVSLPHREAGLRAVTPVPRSLAEVPDRRSRVPVLDLILLNLTLALFFLYSYSTFVASAVWSYARWAVLLLWMVYLAVRLASSRERPAAPLPLSSKICGLMLAWFGITALLAGSDPDQTILKLGALAMLYLLGYLLVGRLIHYSDFMSLFIMSLAAQTVGFLVHGLWLQIDPGELGSARQFGLYHRGGSPSMMAATLLSFSVALLVVGRLKRLFKVGLVGLGVFALLTLYATGTRSGLVVFLLPVAFWFTMRYRKRFGMLLLAFLTALTLGSWAYDWYDNQQVYARGRVLSGREVRYQSQVELFMSSPFLGTGFASSVPAELAPEGHGKLSRSGASVRPLSHSAYLGAFTETGILGGLLFIAWMVACLYEATRRALSRPDDWRAQFGFLFVTGLVAASVIESLLLTAGGPLNLAFYLMVGLIPPENRAGRPVRAVPAVRPRGLKGNGR